MLVRYLHNARVKIPYRVLGYVSRVAEGPPRPSDAPGAAPLAPPSENSRRRASRNSSSVKENRHRPLRRLCDVVAFDLGLWGSGAHQPTVDAGFTIWRAVSIDERHARGGRGRYSNLVDIDRPRILSQVW
jgi:hypothetical protein